MTSAADLHRQFLGEHRNVVIPRTYLEFLDGDYTAALVLREAVFWTTHYNEHKPERDGWWWRNEDDWKDQLYLSRKQVNRAIGVINVRAGGELIEKAVRKVAGENATHYRLDTDRYEALFGRGSSRTAQWASQKPPSGQVKDRPTGNPLTYAQPTDTTNGHNESMSAGADTSAHLSSSELFELFWRRYPKGRGSKKSSRAQWDRLRVDADLFEQILAGLAAWELSHEWREPQYIRHCERWLRDRMWENPPAPAAPTGPPRLRDAGSTKHHGIDNFQRKWGIGPYAAGTPDSDADVIDVEGGPR